MFATKSCSSTHLSPKYKAALLFGACQSNDETPAFPRVAFPKGGANFAESL